MNIQSMKIEEIFALFDVSQARDLMVCQVLDFKEQLETDFDEYNDCIEDI